MRYFGGFVELVYQRSVYALRVQRQDSARFQRGGLGSSSIGANTMLDLQRGRSRFLL